MRYLHINTAKRATEPVVCFKYKDMTYPTKNETKEVFIYGQGRIKIPKPSKLFTIAPLPENYNATDIREAYSSIVKYVSSFDDIQVMYELIGLSNPNDCVHYGWASELYNILILGVEYDNYIEKAFALDEKMGKILYEKYGLVTNGEWTKSTKCEELLEFRGKSPLFARQIELSMCGLFTTEPRYDPFSHEAGLISMLCLLENHGLLGRKALNDYGSAEMLEFRDTLDNSSVKMQIELLYNKDIADEVEVLMKSNPRWKEQIVE